MELASGSCDSSTIEQKKHQIYGKNDQNTPQNDPKTLQTRTKCVKDENFMTKIQTLMELTSDSSTNDQNTPKTSLNCVKDSNFVTKIQTLMELTSGSCDSTTIDPKKHQKMMYEGCDESNELELGLGLSIGTTKSHEICNKSVQIPRIFTANDLNSSPKSANSAASSSLGLRKSDTVCVGTKRAASPTSVSQVVGWPPIRSYRMNSMANQAKSMATAENNSQFDKTKGKKLMYDAEDKGKANSKDKLPNKSSLFVKVNMDGVAIGRKVDLASHSSYESLARTLEEMFTNSDDEKSNAEELNLMPKATIPSKLLDGTSDFVLTYEDKDGDWMLVGDVPWGMFVTSVKRLKIMRTSEANGLAPRVEDRSSKQKR